MGQYGADKCNRRIHFDEAGDRGPPGGCPHLGIAGGGGCLDPVEVTAGSVAVVAPSMESAFDQNGEQNEIGI